MLSYHNHLKKNARSLRKNMTDAEQLLWSCIRMKQLAGLQFYRQKVISNYIVDFYCPKAKLVIELDGGQHFTDEMSAADSIRDRNLNNLGLKVIRFTDTDVLSNIEGVVENIMETLGLMP